MARSNKITTYPGELFVDDRGVLKFINGFDFKDIKRFYLVENFGKKIIRAFHGHLKEGKYFSIVSGSIILCAVKLDNIENPSKKLKVERFVLSDKKPQIIFIPPGFANGFRALEENTKVLIYSTSKLKDSLKDDYRFPSDYWGEEIWKVENR